MAQPASTASPSSPQGNPFRTAALLLLGLALPLSAYLVYASLSSNGVAGCDAGNCGAVLGSKWAKVFGVPVGLFGGAAYLTLLVLGMRPFAASQPGARTIARALAVLIPAAALWFVLLQAAVIHAFCPWCCTTHAIASVGAVLMLIAWARDEARPAVPASGRRRGQGGARQATLPGWGASLALAGTAMAGFLGAQMASPEPPRARPLTATMATADPNPSSRTPSSTPTPSENAATVPPSTPPTPGASAEGQPATNAPAAPSTVAPTQSPPALAPRRIALHEGRFQIDPLSYPCNGTPDAEHLVVMISDYTCPHCRAAYKLMKEVRETFDARQLSYVMLPSHHGGDSFELQLLMLSGWRVDPSVWAELSADLYLEKLPLKPDTVRQILRQRLGPDRFDSAYRESRPWIDGVIALARDIHAANKARTGSGSIPQFIMGPEIVVGAPADATDLFRLLEKNLTLVRKEFPDLRLVQGEMALGRVFSGTGPTVSIQYTNAGSTRLLVSRATVPQGGRTLRGLQIPVDPGGTGTVDVAVVVPRTPGPFEQVITLFSNSRAAEHPFTVRGEAWKPIRVEPAFLDLGRIDPDSGSVTQAVMRIDLDEPAPIQSVTAQNPGFQAVLREVTPGRSYEVIVSPSHSLPPGPHQTTLLVALAKPLPAGWPENLAFAARAVVETAVSTIPQRLLVPPGALSADRHQQVLIRCNDGTPGFTVEDAAVDGGPAVAAPQITPGSKPNEFLVRFTLPAGWASPPPPLAPRLQLRTTHPRYPTLSIPIVQQGR